MRIEHVSDHAGDLLGAAQQQVRTATADLTARRHEHRRAVGELEAARRSKPLWKRVLTVPAPGEKAARARLSGAEEQVRRASVALQGTEHRVREQAAGVGGEDPLARSLADLPDDWVLLRGYRNRGGEAGHLLVGPSGVWVVEAKTGPVRVHIDGDAWRYEALDRWGNAVEAGWATDGSDRSWARQVADPAQDLADWLRTRGHTVPVRTAVVLLHPRAEIGRSTNLTVDLVTNSPQRLLEEMHLRSTPLNPGQCAEIVALVRRDHRAHARRRTES
jgi:hypothetical protein